jgi:plastocyanin
MKNRPPSLLLLVWLLVLCACEEGSHPAAPVPPKAPSEVSFLTVELAELTEARAFDSDLLGAVHGVIRVTGDVPARFPLGARKMSECCQFDDVEHLSDIVVAAEGKLKNAFVSVISGFQKADIPTPSALPVVVDQRGCIYSPHVTGLQVGQKLRIATSDPTAHNVNMSAPGNRLSPNIAMVAGQDPVEFVFRRPDLIKLRCDLHPWMTAQVHVCKHPWFAVSDAAGAFRIPNLPPGNYVIEVQHEEFGVLRGGVAVEARRSAGVAFEFVAD